MNGFENTDPQLTAKRLVLARKRRGLTQDEVAERLGVSRPTLIAIEKGTRPAKPDEILKLADLYGRHVNELVRTDAPVVELQPHLRAAFAPRTQESPELDEAIDELERFAADYRALETMLNAPLLSMYPPEIEIPSRGQVSEWAEDTAVRERSKLGLGDQPVLDVRDLLESEVGLRIFYWGMPSQIAGLYAFTADSGPCILVNRKHPPERRRASIVHEYGHFLTERYRPGIDYLDSPARRPAAERFVEAFGMAFLMPRTGVRRHFAEIIRSTKDFQVADLCRLSHLYFVSVQAMALRLEQLGLIPAGTYEFLLERGFKPQTARQELSLEQQRTDPDTPYPTRYLFLAIKAYEEELLTEGQLARYLRTDRVEARRLVAEWNSRATITDQGREVALEFDRSLLRKEG